ncbi:MAG: tetratricopeptide repeat protein [Desulfobulbus sp.]|jgi:TPR repeat protein|nr:tetratricopeptide repeat protein [Desulfobulbus sp.]
MSANKLSDKKLEDDLRHKERLEAYRKGLGLYYNKEYAGAMHHFFRAYDEHLTPCNINSLATYYLAVCDTKFRDYDEAIEWFKISYLNGNSLAAYELGEMYENGEYIYNECYDPEITLVEPNDEMAFEWYKKAAEMGNYDAMYKCSEYYRDGMCVIRNYEKSFLWLLQAACYRMEYRPYLSDYFFDGIGVEDNVYEAYIWAVMAQNHCSEERVLDLEGILDKKKIKYAQREAEKRDEILGEMGFDGKKLYEYMTQEVLTKTLKPKDKTEPKTAPTPVPKAPTEEEEPIITSEVEYKYLRNCKKGFNPEEVLIELVIDTEIKGDQEIDFDSIIVSYKDAGRDKKLRHVLPKYIHKRHRRFLLKLAIQFSKGKDEINSALERVIYDCEDRSMVSKINNMFLELFPGCHKYSHSNMINHHYGRLFPKLKVDVFKIIDSHDYKNWYNC